MFLKQLLLPAALPAGYTLGMFLTDEILDDICGSYVARISSHVVKHMSLAGLNTYRNMAIVINVEELAHPGTGTGIV